MLNDNLQHFYDSIILYVTCMYAQLKFGNELQARSYISKTIHLPTFMLAFLAPVQLGDRVNTTDHDDSDIFSYYIISLDPLPL